MLVFLIALPSYAGEADQDARVQKGKVWYEQYCTPCHGAGGAPGSAVFPGTNRPVDLRTYEQRNGGRFPSWKWWDITFAAQPGNVHTTVWNKIREGQPAAVDRDINARGMVANIEQYVRTVQAKSK
jgi:hypothetical protein